MSYEETLRQMNLSEEILTKQEYEEALQYARRKASLNGMDESYIPLLLPDVIKERLFSRWTIARYMIMTEATA